LFGLGDGGAVHRLPAHVHAIEPSWSLDGTKLAFAKVGSVGSHQIAVLQGTRLRTLTRNAYGWDSQPTWSPDGARIAFVRVRSWALWEKRALFVRGLTGGAAHRLSDAVAPDHPAWSPDGRSIVVDGLRNDPGHHTGLRLVDPATGNVTDLTHPEFGFDRI